MFLWFVALRMEEKSENELLRQPAELSVHPAPILFYLLIYFLHSFNVKQIVITWPAFLNSCTLSAATCLLLPQSDNDAGTSAAPISGQTPVKSVTLQQNTEERKLLFFATVGATVLSVRSSLWRLSVPSIKIHACDCFWKAQLADWLFSHNGQLLI